MNLADETFPQSHQGPERPLTTPKVEVQSPMLVRRDGHDEQIQTPYGGFLMSREGFRPMECPLDLDDLRRMLLRGLHTINRAETPSSMTNEPDGSGDHSLASSTILSVRCGTPGPGLGGWTEEAPLLPNYHFLKSPLRLTPQRRYCRGLVAAHLVLDDDMTDHHNYPKSISGEHLADPELAVTNF
ncbi:hypothetical protein K432DRAFT_379128 [Lepidopterella palustris CBS 459.81]|uniref:Uncharacterized protein n=1 Tax=Lepidopterella palustris CBS 459.81 TaxID=1314670 RepID=A0A8E2EHA0_9PEZI|nr:hypothetical protein K432DRAFT_379128 [Lepidopterella palustris CBS 459.81]